MEETVYRHFTWVFLDFLLMQSLKRVCPMAVYQWLMSYLIQELTNWRPFRLDVTSVKVTDCVSREKSRCGGFQLRANRDTPMQSFLIWLYCTCFLYQSPPSGLELRGWGDFSMWKKLDQSLSLCMTSTLWDKTLAFVVQRKLTHIKTAACLD